MKVNTEFIKAKKWNFLEWPRQSHVCQRVLSLSLCLPCCLSPSSLLLVFVLFVSAFLRRTHRGSKPLIEHICYEAQPVLDHLVVKAAT